MMKSSLDDYFCEMKNSTKDGRKSQDLRVGDLVEIVQKKHQQSGELTEGFIKRFLTKSTFHPHGIKVMLQTGEVGRVKSVIPEDD